MPALVSVKDDLVVECLIHCSWNRLGVTLCPCKVLWAEQLDLAIMDIIGSWDCNGMDVVCVIQDV